MPEDNYKDCMKGLKESQDTDEDNRKMARQADYFLNKRDGQWEPAVISKFSGKPRYTFDEVTPIIDDIMGEMETMDFDIRVQPGSGDASKDNAEAYEGIIRNIENVSRAKFVYNAAARIMIGTGMSGWRVVNDFKDEDSFDQELLIKAIPNFVDNVWFDPGFQAQTAGDADFVHVLTSMTGEKYQDKYGKKGSMLSVGQDRDHQAYSYKKPDEIVVGEYLYRKKSYRELAMMTNGHIYVVDDDFKNIVDDLAVQGITVHKTRKRPYYRVYSRMYDGGDWLTDDKETVFTLLPIIPVYGNFKISEDKVIFWGIVEKLQDAQRIINYSESRKVEETALSPKPKFWMTREQAVSAEVRRTLRTLNLNTDPVQFYDYAEGQPSPYMQGPSQTNPALMETTQTARAFIERSSSTYDEARGTAPAQRSGSAIGLLQQKSDNPKRKWFTAMEIALTQTFDIIVKALPNSLTPQQEVRLLSQDGSSKTITFRERVRDAQTGQIHEIMDLSKGSYSVTVSAGPAFTSRQQETVNTITELSAIDPSIIQIGADVMLNNINSPGIDQITERKRAQMVSQGIIPPTQLTDEEKQQVAQQQQQPKQPDPMMIAAQAEMAKAEAKQQETQIKAQIEMQRMQLKQIELSIAKEKSDREAILLKEKQDRESMMEAIRLQAEEIQAQAEALKTIKDAMGADAIVSPAAVSAYESQARNLRRSVTGPTNQ